MVNNSCSSCPENKEQNLNSTTDLSICVKKMSFKASGMMTPKEKFTSCLIEYYKEDDDSDSSSSGIELEISDLFMDDNKSNDTDDPNEEPADLKKSSNNSILQYLKNKSSNSVNIVGKGKEFYMEF